MVDVSRAEVKPLRVGRRGLGWGRETYIQTEAEREG